MVEVLKNEIPLEQESVVLTEDTVNGLVLVDIINGFCTVGAGNLVSAHPVWPSTCVLSGFVIVIIIISSSFDKLEYSFEMTS